jgi:hypothetical protein
MDFPIIIFCFLLFLLFLFPLITVIKNLNLSVCTNCNKGLNFKYFIFGKFCIKSCISCNKNFIRKTRRANRS